MMKMYFIYFMLLCAGSLSAQNISFSLEIDQDTIRVGDEVTVTYKLSGARGDFKAPDFEGMRLVGGPNYSSQISIVQGKMDQTFTYSYVLQVIEEGDYLIPEALVSVDGEEYSSPSAKLHVTANPDWNPQQSKPIVPRKKKSAKDKNVTQI
jgi:hypothetical protein